MGDTRQHSIFHTSNKHSRRHHLYSSDFESTYVDPEHFSTEYTKIYGSFEREISRLRGRRYDDHKEVNNSMKLALRPLIISLKIVGSHHERSGSSIVSISTVHAAFMTLVSFLNTVRMVSYYSEDDHFGSVLLSKVAIHVWSTQATIGLLIYFFQVSPGFPKFLNAWTSYKRDYGGFPMEKIRTFTKRFIICLWIYHITAITLLLCLLIPLGRMERLNRLHLSIFYKNGEAPPLSVQYTAMAIIGLVIYAWALIPASGLAIMCYILRCEFLTLYLKLEDAMYSKRSKSVDIENMRKQHQKLCKLVAKLNDIYSLYYFLQIALYLPVTCTSIYTMMFPFEPKTDTLMEVILGIFSVGTLFGYFIALMIPAISLTYAANKPKHVLYDLHSGRIRGDFKTSLKIQVFLARLTSGHIGMTAWGMIDVTRGALCTVFSLILTFVVILIKFRISLGAFED